MVFRNKRNIVISIVILIVLALGIWWWQVEGQYRNIEFVSGDPEFNSPKEYTRYYEALKRAYAKDQYGGDTPEETLQLFIDALKAGDVELASKYFVVEERGYVKENLPLSFTSGAAKEIIQFYETGVIKKSGEGDYYEIDLLPEESGIGYSFTLILNTQTGKWKMYEL